MQDTPSNSKTYVVSVGEHRYYMDGYLKQNLDRAKDIIKKDWDMLFLYDGYEGSGKSVKAMQDAYYFDPTFNLDRICFDPRKFTKAIKNADKYQAIVYDEAYTGLSSRAAMSLINRTLVKMLAEIRQRRLFVAIVMPTFFDVDKYVALWRSRALIHIYTGENFQRGHFAFYNMERKKSLYVNGKKFYSYGKPKPNFYGKFTNYYVVDEEAYRDAKRMSLVKQQSNEEEAMVQQLVKNKMFESLVEIKDMTHVQKQKVLGMPDTTYWTWLKKYNETGEL